MESSESGEVGEGEDGIVREIEGVERVLGGL